MQLFYTIALAGRFDGISLTLDNDYDIFLKMFRSLRKDRKVNPMLTAADLDGEFDSDFFSCVAQFQIQPALDILSDVLLGRIITNLFVDEITNFPIGYLL